MKDRKEPKFNKIKQETGGSKHEKNVKNCFLCGKSGHFAKDCFVKKKILAALIPDSGSDSDGSDSQSGDKSGSCNSQHDQSFGEKSTSLCGCHMSDAKEVVLQCGHKLPILSSCVDKLPKNMPVSKGFVSGQLVQVLRDTGCSGVVVQESLVSDKQYVGKKQRCAFIDGSGGHGGRVVTLSPPTSEAGVRSLSWPEVGKLVVACRWSAVYSTEP